MSIALRVECGGEYRKEGSPLRIFLDELKVEVVKILDRWPAADHRYFKFIGDDGALYIIRHDPPHDFWELILYDARMPEPAREHQS